MVNIKSSLKLKSMLSSAVFLGLAMAVTFGLAAPSSAKASSFADCPANALCFWEHPSNHPGGMGARLTFMGPFAVRGSCQNMTSYAGWNDRISAWRNRLSYSATTVTNINCPQNLPPADYEFLAPGSQGNFTWYPNDDISSVKFN